MRRLLIFVVALLVGLGIATPSSIAAAAPANVEQAHRYGYDIHYLSEMGSGSADGRGPPALDRLKANDAVGRWSDGAMARTQTNGTFRYNHVEHLALVARGMGTTQGFRATKRQPAVLEPSSVAANGAEDTVSLFKASQRGLGESHYANGYAASDFPGNGAYFAKEKELADSFATHYGEGVIETKVPRSVYEEHFAQHEMPFLGSPPGTELAIPPDKLELLSQFERIWHR